MYSVDWTLLAFLLLFLNVKLVVKIAALVLVFILRPNFKLGFAIRNSRLPLFYLLVIVIAIFNWLFSGQIGNFNYDIVLATGILFWVLCILAIHQIKLSVEKNDPAIIHRTIVVFFIINALASLFVYAGIVLETGVINAYLYQGNFQKYFIGTGDYIKGITFDTSTANAVLNALGVIYFLARGKNLPALLCMLVLLLTGSNITNILLCLVLIVVFFSQADKNKKSIIIVCLMMMIVFFVKISPQNNNYAAGLYQQVFNIKPNTKKTPIAQIPVTQKPDSILTSDEKKEKIAQLYMDSINILRYNEILNNAKTKTGTLPEFAINEKPIIPVANIHTAAYQHKDDTSMFEKKLLQFVEKNNSKFSIVADETNKLKMPGKLIALQQTYSYLNQHRSKIITGTGIGNFSSKLAFRSTALKISGNYPESYAYINDGFKTNHLALYIFYFTSSEGMHSIANSPNNTYDQLLSEYGLAGIFAFAFFYIGFFIKQSNKNTYAIPSILLMLGVFFADYWFEQLSVVVFFELLLLLNFKELKSE